MNKKLGTLATIHYGKSPSEVLFEDGPYPIVGTGGIYGQASKALFASAIVVPRKGSLGNPQLIESPFWPVDTTYAVVPNSNIDVRWLYYCLLNFDLTKLNEATGVPSISRDWLSKIEFYDPGGDQRKRIGAILAFIDQAIEKTEALIHKCQQIKAGLMHDLFTRGVTADGKLRPPREQTPELYKETPLGWMPEEWIISAMGRYIEKYLYGPRFDARLYSLSGNVKTIRGTDFSKEGGIIYNQAPIAQLPLAKIGRHILQEGDVVIVTTADCGLSAVFERQKMFFIPSAYTVKYRFSTKVNPYFAKYYMQSSHAKMQVRKYVRQGTLGNLPGSDLLRFWIQMPEEKEQIRIVERLEPVEKKVEEEKKYLVKLKKQKSGLMNDLLTGKVQVKVD
jgi:type I restriction enzyme, S subunit